MTGRLLPLFLAALAVPVLFNGCGGRDAPAYNGEALLYTAILVPADGKALAPDSAALEKVLAGTPWPDPAWEKAAAAGKAVLDVRGLKVELGSPRDFPIPNVQYLTGFGYGMNPADMARCAAATQAYQIILTLPPADVPRLYPGFQALTLAAARAMGGYIYDVTAKIAFTPAEYGQALFQPAGWSLPRHVLVQRYPYEPGKFRTVTLGMAKFGCPEVEARDFPAQDALLFQHLVGAAAARLAARRLAPGEPGPFPATLEMDPASVRDVFSKPVAGSKPGGDAVRVRLTTGETAEGDPQDRIVRLAPPEDFRGGMAEWAARLSEKILGYGLKVETMAAGGIPADRIGKARAGLAETRGRFQAAAVAGEEYYVKFAFSVKGAGVEYLWLKVSAWDGRGVAGVLVTEPVLAKRFTAGSPVRVAEADVVDWLIRGPNGKAEGRFTE